MSSGDGGMLGGGGFFGRASEQYGPRGPFGIWPGCGCSSLFFILAIILFLCGGCLRMFETGLRF